MALQVVLELNLDECEFMWVHIVERDSLGTQQKYTIEKTDVY